jgi:hypothetical protein
MHHLPAGGPNKFKKSNSKDQNALNLFSDGKFSIFKGYTHFIIMKSLILLVVGLLSPFANYSQINESYLKNDQIRTQCSSTSLLFATMIFDTIGHRLELKYIEGMKRDRAIQIMSTVKEFYNSQSTYPERVKDGWHTVVAMNNTDFCEERKVFVENNLVTNYVIDDWLFKDILSPAQIQDCRSSVLINDDGRNDEMLDLYFLDYLIDQNSCATPPVGSGTISFWSDGVQGGKIVIYIDGRFIGELDSHFKKSIPDCGQTGTLTIEDKSGIHDFRAVNKKNVWRGSIKINHNDCVLQELLESNNTASGYK